MRMGTHMTSYRQFSHDAIVLPICGDHQRPQFNIIRPTITSPQSETQGLCGVKRPVMGAAVLRGGRAEIHERLCGEFLETRRGQPPQLPTRGRGTRRRRRFGGAGQRAALPEGQDLVLRRRASVAGVPVQEGDERLEGGFGGAGIAAVVLQRVAGIGVGSEVDGGHHAGGGGGPVASASPGEG